MGNPAAAKKDRIRWGFCRKRPTAKWNSRCNSSMSIHERFRISTCLRCCQHPWSNGLRSGAYPGSASKWTRFAPPAAKNSWTAPHRWIGEPSQITNNFCPVCTNKCFRKTTLSGLFSDFCRTKVYSFPALGCVDKGWAILVKGRPSIQPRRAYHVPPPCNLGRRLGPNQGSSARRSWTDRLASQGQSPIHRRGTLDQQDRRPVARFACTIRALEFCLETL